MNEELIEILKMEALEPVGKVITGLKRGQVVEIDSIEGPIRGMVKVVGKHQLILTLLDAFTSPKAHSYHWEVGDLKSVPFKRINKIKRVMYTMNDMAQA